MRVFISHKQDDNSQAIEVNSVLKRYGIDSYLDIVDNYVSQFSPERLTAHILQELGRCTHVIPVISDNTQKSWWVPFEIGAACEQGRVIATYLTQKVSLPEFLHGWPIMNSLSDVEAYAKLATSEKEQFRDYEKKSNDGRRAVAKSFERSLKNKLITS